MRSLALKILFGDRAKLFGLIAGVAFATVLITQQGGLFVGLMTRVQNVIADAGDVDIWVMDPSTEQVNLAKPMRHAQLMKVRGVPGVASAAPLFKANLPVRGQGGKARTAMLLGVDSTTYTGITKRFFIGSPMNLRQPDAIAIDRVGFMRLWPGEPVKPGKTLELNDRRAKIVAIPDAAAAFSAQVILHTPYNRASKYVPHGRNRLSFVLVKVSTGIDAKIVAAEIEQRTGLKAELSQSFSEATVRYYLKNTGITINFATTIILGIVVGMAIVGLTFSLFVNDNLKHYAVLKALGATNFRLAKLVAYQIAVVTFIGFAIGTGVAAAFFELVSSPTSALRGFFIPWWMPLITLAVMSLSIILSTSIALRRVLVVEAATVFRV